MAMVERRAGAPRRSPPAGHERLGWLQRRNLLRAEVGAVAVFHLLGAAFLVVVPRRQIVTPGTADIFGTIPLPVWTVWFLVTGVAAAATVHRLTPGRIWTMWGGTFPLATGWLYGFAVAVADGRGNVFFPLAWSFLLLWWTFTAARLYLGGSEAWWGGR